LATIVEKRLCLHQSLAKHQQQNEELKEHLERLQPLANVGTVTCMIAHEVNNLLTPLTNFAALALNNPEDPALANKALQKVIQNCRRASEIMESMLNVANGQSQKKTNTRLIALVQEVFKCLCRDFTKDGIKVQLCIPANLEVWAIPVQIQHLLMNLILNAREAMLPRGGILTISTRETNDTLCIEVADTGCGIEPEHLKNIFNPFFTTKMGHHVGNPTVADQSVTAQRCGFGLGLAFCKRVIEEHKGLISVESEPDKGTKFTITLPKRQENTG
jgi:signal transduction histidine kinase